MALSRHWSVLQVVAIVVCYRGTVLTEKVQGCVGSQLSLRCPEMKVIQIRAVVLGDSNCQGTSCCIEDNDCTHNANENHRKDVHKRCENKQSCIVTVLQEKIPCWYLESRANNDFERITYICIDDPQRTTTATPSRSYSTEDNLCTEKNPPEKETENDNTTSSTEEQNKEGFDESSKIPDENGEDQWVVPVVMATICLLVLIAIIVVVVMMRRKRWQKGGVAVEMTDIDSSDRNEAIYANENQTVSLNNGSGSPIYSNDKMKKLRDAKITDTYEIPINGVYSLADDAGSSPTEDSNVYCDIHSREPAYQVPRSDVYSVVRDIGKPECAGSAADASNEDNNVYCDVDTREPVKAANSSAANAYDEAINWKESEYKAVKADKTIPPAQRKELASPAHKTAWDSKDKLSTSDGFPSPSYETMSPGIPEGIYANAPALSPSWSVASRALSTGGSDTENAYCDMQSPPVRFKDDGSQTVVENDLYSH